MLPKRSPRQWFKISPANKENKKKVAGVMDPEPPPMVKLAKRMVGSGKQFKNNPGRSVCTWNEFLLPLLFPYAFFLIIAHSLTHNLGM